MNQFNFRRFWRLMYAKIIENIRIVVFWTVILTLGALIYKIYMVLFSSDSLAESLTNAAGMYIPGVMMVYFLTEFKFILDNTGRRFFMLPVTNLERYAAMQLLPILSVAFTWIVSFFCSESLWRFGLWLLTPDVYAQYMEVIPDLQRINLVKMLLYFVLILYFEYALFSNNTKKFSRLGCLVQVLLFALTPVLLIFVVVKIADFLHLNNLVFYAIITILTAMFLLVVSYRGFCRYEPNPEVKSEK